MELFLYSILFIVFSILGTISWFKNFDKILPKNSSILEEKLYLCFPAIMAIVGGGILIY